MKLFGKIIVLLLISSVLLSIIPSAQVKQATISGKARIFKDIEKRMSKINAKKYTIYELFCASDLLKKAKTFRLIKKEAEWIDKQKATINKLLDIESYSTWHKSIIVSAYACDGTHFIAVTYPEHITETAGNYVQWKEAINKVRGKKDEFDFMAEEYDKSGDCGINFCIDLYVENANVGQKTIRLDKFYMNVEYYRYNESNNLERGKDFLVYPYQDVTSNEVFTKYKRTVKWDYVLKNRTWSCYIADIEGWEIPHYYVVYKGKKIALEA